eukprot:snap_masked-scaffold_2-processed-gene-1.25-mRNA-1 protein AED:1.00 eAED:1.00 QI:0/0/0/0/1/1/2/0/92
MQDIQQKSMTFMQEHAACNSLLLDNKMVASFQLIVFISLQPVYASTIILIDGYHDKLLDKQDKRIHMSTYHTGNIVCHTHIATHSVLFIYSA